MTYSSYANPGLKGRAKEITINIVVLLIPTKGSNVRMAAKGKGNIYWGKAMEKGKAG